MMVLLLVFEVAAGVFVVGRATTGRAGSRQQARGIAAGRGAAHGIVTGQQAGR